MAAFRPRYRGGTRGRRIRSALYIFSISRVDKTTSHASDRTTQHTTDDTRRGETRARPWRPPGRRPRCSRTAPQRLPPHIVRWLMTVASPSERWGAGSGCQGCRKLGHKTVEKITVFFNSCWSLDVNTAAALDSYAAWCPPALPHLNGKGWTPPACSLPLVAPTYRLRRARCVDSIDRRRGTNDFIEEVVHLQFRRKLHTPAPSNVGD